jgi:thiamine transport system ATP-binding protein
VSGLSLRDVSVAFGDVRALRDVSLSVERGEFFTLVGPSGCGKTTLLRTVAGFEAPDRGAVEIDGEPVADVAPEDRDVGIVFQDYALFPHMSVRENVAYGLRYRDPPGDVSADERVDELLDLVDMAGTGDREPAELSGGQQQRIALARALAPGPDVLLLDEPLSALDARLRERLRLVIRDIQRTLDITTVYVTHDQAEALAVSDRVAVMNGGRVEQVATPETVYREPASRFVAEFVGDNNLLYGVVASTDPPRVEITATQDPGPIDDAAGGARPDGATDPAVTGNAEAAADGDATVSLPLDVAGPTGRSVTLSIRPEAIALGGADAPVTLSAAVETAEFTGDAYRVHCEWQGQSLLVTATASEAPSGAVTLGFDPADVNVLEDHD